MSAWTGPDRPPMIFPTGINSPRLLCMAHSPMFLRQDRDTTYHPARWVKSRGSDGVARSMGGGGARDTRSRTTAAPTSWFSQGVDAALGSWWAG